jgi:hypothetical protein
MFCTLRTFTTEVPNPDERIPEGIMDAFQQYRETLPHERRVLLDRYHIEDFAMKVVGVGSVGTRFWKIPITINVGSSLFHYNRIVAKVHIRVLLADKEQGLPVFTQMKSGYSYR